MGLSSKKTKSSTKPVYEKEIKGAANAVTGTYQNNIGNVQDISGQISGLVPEMITKYREGDAGVNAARDYNVDVLNGDYLNNNPYVDDLIQQGNNDVMNRQQAILGKRGVGGTSNFTELVGGAINRNSLGTRADIYDRERSRMDGAAGRAPGIAAADAIQIAPLMSAAGASLLPMQAASGYGATIGGLLGPYTNTEQKQSGGFLPGLIGTGLQAAATAGAFSDRRLKTDIYRVGELPDGLPVYDFKYIWDNETIHRGVMADEVEQYQPHALGAEVDGFATVHYGELND